VYKSIKFWKNFLFPKDILKEKGKGVKRGIFGKTPVKFLDIIY